jgi:lipoprotein-releasing system ATP-binding protein
MTLRIEIRDLYRSFSKGNEVINVLKGINLIIESGETVAIIGPSGSGKTTLLQNIGLLDSPSGGSISLNGENTSTYNEDARSLKRNEHFGFIYQFHHLIPEFTALENVMMPLLIRNKGLKDTREESRKLLEAIDMDHRVDHKPSELSGGECQRVAIARALITKPKFILADEPTGNLDPNASKKIFEQFLKLRTNFGSGLILVTHDKSMADQMSVIYEIDGGILVKK